MQAREVISTVLRVVWVLAGVLVIVVLSYGVHILVDVSRVVEDAHQLSSQITIEDVRQTLSIVEKQLDIDKLELEIEKARTSSPLERTSENWEAFLDFCERTGYVVSDRNWHEYSQGRLKE